MTGKSLYLFFMNGKSLADLAAATGESRGAIAYAIGHFADEEYARFVR